MSVGLFIGETKVEVRLGVHVATFELISIAAAQQRINVSDFMLLAAYQAAQEVLNTEINDFLCRNKV